MKTKLTFLMLVLGFISTAQTIVKYTIDSGGASNTVGGIDILYTIGEVNVQELIVGGIQVSHGFINPILLEIKLDSKLFLQGPIQNPVTAGLMNDDLRVDGVIPTTSPYTDGLTCNLAVFNLTGSDAIVDWVWVELRDEVDNTIIIDSQSALLQRDGDVVGVDGVSSVLFNQASGNYFLAINHRNHLGVLSATAIALAGTTTIDLSSDPLAVYGGSNAVKDMGSGIYAMYGGDVDDDGQILNTDITTALLLTGTAGYSGADSDLNGQILNTDITLIIQVNAGKAQQY